MRGLALGLLGLVIVVMVLVNLSPVQRFLARKTAEILSQRLQTTVHVNDVRIDLLNHLVIRGVYIEDHARDTLLYAGEAEVRITDWFFLRRGVPVLTYIGLKDAYVHLYRTAQSAAWNYGFIEDAFAAGPKDTAKTGGGNFEIDLKQAALDNVRFHMDDAWVGSDIDIDVGRLRLRANALDMTRKKLDVSRIAVRGTTVYVGSYPSSKLRRRPPSAASKAPVTDTTPFNPGRWAVQVKRLALDNCVFRLKSDEMAPMPAAFDPAHMDIRDIILHAQNITIDGDTIRGRIAKMAAKERSGFVLQEFRADVTVSPNASICDRLYIRTNNSSIGDYYAMHYDRFPDFTDYISRVRMTGRLKDAVVDARDVAYFAPALRELHQPVLHISGEVAGTVDKLTGKDLDITDGTTIVKGNIAMTGLPDINTTFIDFREGSVRTSGLSILRYAPSLRDNPNIDLEKLSYVYFQGGFTGYINRFIANGVLNTNLGVVRSSVQLLLPPGNGNPEVYEGYVSTEGLNLGALLRQPYLGRVSLYAAVQGRGFDPHAASLRLRARVAQIELNRYNYRNIIAEGTLGQRKFRGNLLVDDPNLALAFDGEVDFSGKKRLSFNARANLLQSDLRALNLTRDSIQFTADFDLNCTGSNLDDFSGYAKLFNINLVRNNNRADLDSVYVLATDDSGRKTLTIQSNDLTAALRGKYQLSKLGYSAQYYLYGYLPNYIPAPKEEAPEQDMEFDIATRHVDKFLAVMTPRFRGFDFSSLNGSLHTGSQQLTLNADIPYGMISDVSISDIRLRGTGNYRTLNMTGEAGRLVIGDTLLNISLNANAVLGNDSLQFNVTTASPNAYGQATINGEAYASGDSLYLTFRPSEFFLSQHRWEIPGGNRIVLGRKYIDITGLTLHSGLQNIAIASNREDQSLDITLKDIDLSQLATVGVFSGYDPDGRLEGKINVADVFGDVLVTGNVQAWGVRLGKDTIGEIRAAGKYNMARNFAVLQPQSGIFRGDASLLASGAFGVDSTSNARMRGQLQFNNTPLSWLSPVLQDYVSNLGGVLNGNVQLKGAASAPDVTGEVSLSHASLRVDYLGTSYTIPRADIRINSGEITFGNVMLQDQYRNEAALTGSVEHDHLRDFVLRLRMTSDKFEVLNLKDYESQNFYGHLIARVSSMSVTGPVDDIRMNIQATPAAASQLYLPMSSGGDVGTYSYASFKTYGTSQTLPVRKSKNKFTININAMATPDLTMTMILDPATGDAINATGTGNVSLEIGTDQDLGLHGVYHIEQGDYTFTFRQLFFRRKFIINAGSSITFGGSLDKTVLDVNATYRTMARLYDLLNDMEKQSQIIPANEMADAKTAQNVDVILFMRGSLEKPDLTFKLEMPEKRSVGTYAYTKLERINSNDRELFDQVASLLLINAFIPPEGLMGTTARSGAINNMSEIISTTASSQLTNIVNKLLGDQSLQIELKYKNYNLSDAALAGGINRNEFRFGVRQNLFKDRVIVEVGSAYDWGRPNANSNATSNFNLAGDFRLQFLLTEDGQLRSNLFRTSNYDVLMDKNISRAGAGISWRKTFDNLEELIRSPKYIREKQQRETEKKDTAGKSAVRFIAPPASAQKDYRQSLPGPYTYRMPVQVPGSW